MISTSFFGLINNISILLLLGFLYDLMHPGLEKRASKFRLVIIGMIVGGIGLIVMAMSWQLVPGIRFDTRSILLCISGLFFGTVPTMIAMAMTITMRLIQGGGAWTGALVIISSGGIGLLWRRFSKGHPWGFDHMGLYLLGGIVHIVMLVIMFITLPEPVILPLLKGLASPIMIFYPLGTVFFGKILYNRL